MSRIGRKPITIPSGVTVAVEGSTVKVKGPKGELSRTFDPSMKFNVADNEVVVERPSDEKRERAVHGVDVVIPQEAATGEVEAAALIVLLPPHHVVAHTQRVLRREADIAFEMTLVFVSRSRHHQTEGLG